jgi:hypothetical protein
MLSLPLYYIPPVVILTTMVSYPLSVSLFTSSFIPVTDTRFLPSSSVRPDSESLSVACISYHRWPSCVLSVWLLCCGLFPVHCVKKNVKSRVCEIWDFHGDEDSSRRFSGLWHSVVLWWDTNVVHHIRSFMRVYPKVSGLAAWSENCKWYSSLLLGQSYRGFIGQSIEFCRHNALCHF